MGTHGPIGDLCYRAGGAESGSGEAVGLVGAGDSDEAQADGFGDGGVA